MIRQGEVHETTTEEVPERTVSSQTLKRSTFPFNLSCKTLVILDYLQAYLQGSHFSEEESR